MTDLTLVVLCIGVEVDEDETGFAVVGEPVGLQNEKLFSIDENKINYEDIKQQIQNKCRSLYKKDNKSGSLEHTKEEVVDRSA